MKQVKKKLMQKHLDKALLDHERIVKEYKRKYSEDRKTRDGKRDWRTYEQRLALRIKTATRELVPVAEEAFSMIKISRPAGGRPREVPVPKCVVMLLIKDIFRLSNRKFANMLALFSAFTGIDISYKTVERIYSDELAKLTVHNMFLILAKKKGIRNADVSGDGTGYSLTITKHYRSERELELANIGKEDAGGDWREKKRDGQKRKCFVRSFALMDLGTGMYLGYGTSMSSEHEAYHEAMEMAGGMGTAIDSVRLDKLYSYQSVTDDFSEDTKIYVIPKKNATIKGSPAWKRIVRSYVADPFGHLSEYYKRNNSESGFSTDKRMCGWKIWQKRNDRIGTALMCKDLWHNLMLLG